MAREPSLKEVRKEVGFTQKEMAEEVKVSESLISRLENNKTIADKKLKYAIEDVLGTKMSWPRRVSKRKNKQNITSTSNAEAKEDTPIADQVTKLLAHFMDECKSTINLDNYNKDFSVKNETFTRLLHSLWFEVLDYKTSKLDCVGIPYNHICHIILPNYKISKERKWDDNLWLSLANIYNDKLLMRRVYNANTKEYRHKISYCDDRISLSSIRDRFNVHVRDVINRCGGLMRQQQMENLLRAELEYYINATEAIKNG